ncbi:pyrroline-5-carboxylate reductase [Notoacmeibacter sp. MSK16QG-6]|uniref:pyrroline-5-carboxylate reductase n=1 Tax=Notoacmeibacter sp. MSK16QG-6 TaxID=2957982 RepID=UPI00209D831B|nr:pyrroline-5-carboxylate reductase [Notoacmeibacter sp. MSK16QG-6]MCP1198563.1 pyrroline-5-carboxylate reductase [Notoacmeibacter sp. MSK16QG-6]
MRILMVGCGNMGFAILKAWLGSEAISADAAGVVEPGEAGRNRAASLGVATYAEAPSPETFPADLIVLALKPQIMGDVAPAYRPYTESGAAIMTIAAGLPIAFYEAIFGAGTPVIRVMPNTPAAIGEGMMAFIANASTTESLIQQATQLLKANGAVAELKNEAQMDAVTAISGSGPAYLFHFLEALTDAGEKIGLEPDMAALLARQTVLGAAKLAADGDVEPAELRRQVTSPNGTTAAGLAPMMEGDRLKLLMREVAEAAKLRSIELSR